MRNKKIKIFLIGLMILLFGWGIGKWAFPTPSERISGPRFLIINADDFGADDDITQGIIQAWREGVVSSMSAMINMDGAPERIALAHRQYPNLPIGLHLNITEGRPVLPPDKVPTLVDANGNFYTSETIIEHLPDISLNELRAELNAQAELMLHAGIVFDHIDYHQHMVALYTPFYPIIMEIAEKYGVPVRQPVPESIYGQVKLQSGGGSAEAIRQMMAFGMKHPVLAMKMMPVMSPAAYKDEGKALRQHGLNTPNWFIDTFYGNASVSNLISILEQLPPGVSEIMVHPGLTIDSDGYDRTQELQVLTDRRIKQALTANQIEEVDYSFVTVNAKR
jgi:predicted glycoside hydrolase/deacetylase ChbG (UPF0249 family)